MSLIWDHTGTKLGPKGYPVGSLEGPLGVLGGLWEVLGDLGDPERGKVAVVDFQGGKDSWGFEDSWLCVYTPEA